MKHLLLVYAANEVSDAAVKKLKDELAKDNVAIVYTLKVSPNSGFLTGVQDLD